MKVMSMSLTALLGLALVAATARAQGFEGTMTYRSLSVESDSLHRVLGDAAMGDEGIAASAVFAIPMEQIVALAREDEFLASVEDVTYTIKGKKLRMESGGYFAIMDLEAEVIRMFQSAEKVCMELTLAQIEQLNQQAVAYAGEWKAAQVRRLDETKTINGMRAESYELRSTEGITLAWVSDEHPDLVAALRRIVDLAAFENEEGGNDAIARLTEYGLPILVKTYDREGQTYQIEEILAVEPGSVSPDVFEVPAGYEKRSFLGMGG